jgi:hypothetical protein
MEKREWREAVFKPAVGASAYGLCRLCKGEMDGEDANNCSELLKTNAGLLQPFISSVCTKGKAVEYGVLIIVSLTQT